MLALYAQTKTLVNRQIVSDILKEDNIALTSIKAGRSSTQKYRVALLSLAGITLILLTFFVARMLGLR